MSLELIVTFKFIKINAKDDSFLLFFATYISEHDFLCSNLYYKR